MINDDRVGLPEIVTWIKWAHRRRVRMLRAAGGSAFFRSAQSMKHGISHVSGLAINWFCKTSERCSKLRIIGRVDSVGANLRWA